MNEKIEKLENLLRDYKSALIAFSGGVDSTYILKIAKNILGDNVKAVTAVSDVQMNDEVEATKELASKIGVELIIAETNELEREEYVSNPEDRCYHCKHILYSEIMKIARDENLNVILDGTNADDIDDYRPGMKALEELEILSPLKIAGLTKSEIREHSKILGLPTSEKPAMACLSSRIPYGTRITKEKLRRVDEAESFLRGEGFIQVRVRDHDDIARIEVEKDKLELILANGFSDRVVEKFKELGYLYITLDLEGYTMGSLNKKVLRNG